MTMVMLSDDQCHVRNLPAFRSAARVRRRRAFLPVTDLWQTGLPMAHPADSAAALQRVAEIMAGFPASWFVAGGWAIDLYLGRITRHHKDVEIAMFRRDQGALHAHFPDWRLRKVVGRTRSTWQVTEWLGPPVHQLEVRRTATARIAFEVLFNERHGHRWVFRRNPAITRPVVKVVLRSRAAVPFLAPEVVLLYKAKHLRFVDQQDFYAASERLDTERRVWLLRALAICHPGHPWLTRLWAQLRRR
jgi:aminoglycoside-2''-adenylyltransferase